jgi:hypothetical protein
MRDSVQGLLDTIDDRLSAIERHLGITPPVPEAADERAGEADELTRLQARVARLEERLRGHGLDPEEPREPPAAAG